MRSVRLQKDRDLLDPNFSGYKLSLESVSVTPVDLSATSGAEHLQPDSGEYGYLHAKLYGEHNHLVLDPWAEQVYWLARTGEVMTLTEGRPRTVWKGMDTGLGPRYNSNLVFIGRSEAVLSDGRGRLDILHTGDRQRSAVWRSVFSDFVCGKDRPFLAVTGEVRENNTIEVVVQYVEEEENKDGFRNVLEWISFSQSGSSLVMDRVRRVVTKGGVNTVSVVQGKLVVSAQKEAELVFDSMAGLDELTDAELEAVSVDTDEKKASFYWKQSEEDVEVWCYGGEEVSKSSVQVTVGPRLEVLVCGQCLLSGELRHSVETDDWTWTLEGGKLAVMMSKRSPSHWDTIWSEAGGTLGEEVIDLTEDTCLANLTTETPIVGDNKNSTFNSEQLEDCDDCDSSDCLTWFGGEERISVSLSGHQHLFSVVEAGQAKRAIVARHDVDGLVWSIEEDGVKHVATFPALGYVQASKTSRKFLSAPPSCSYSVICDNSRHLYLYRQPRQLAAETELRNRKSGQRIEKVAVQQVVTLETLSDVIGCAALENSLLILTREKLFSVQTLDHQMLAVTKRLSSQTWRFVRLSSPGSQKGFKDTSSERGWKNETPAGSSTEVFVYNPEFDIKWPNQQLGVLASKDKNFVLPGDIGSLPDGRLGSLQVPPPKSHPDILSTPTQRESQVHTLYNANDFIKYTTGSEKDIFSDPKMLREFPDLPSIEMMDLEVHDAPALVRRELGYLFPEEDLSSGPLSVLTMSFYTDNDMSKWSEEMEEEREKLMEHSVVICKELCGRFKDDGYWADFIDPASGTPHYSAHTNSTLFETSETYRALGFEIDDLGCCKVISHIKFGHHVFVATIVTNCSVESDVMGNLEEEFSSFGYR